MKRRLLKLVAVLTAALGFGSARTSHPRAAISAWIATKRDLAVSCGTSRDTADGSNGKGRAMTILATVDDDDEPSGACFNCAAPIDEQYMFCSCRCEALYARRLMQEGFDAGIKLRRRI
jgi:hypothetical protein